ncbi:MAG: asparaginase [Rubellimicrobium sp.]|nr:asparaginase [Rubellimicrobium sp.]
MKGSVDLVEVWRGDILECTHRGHAVVMREGEVIHAWGDPGAVIYPRSSAKMLQALPLVESGAADALGLRSDQIALACASHVGAAYHTDRVRHWIADLGLGDDDFRCGAHEPTEIAARDDLIRSGGRPCQYHNNCSGKHAGFLSLNRHVGGGPEYVDPDHPVQRAVRAAFEEVTGEESPGYGIDGCSAPNFATTVTGLARAMSTYATAGRRSGARDAAQARLVGAMVAHPELIAGEGRACTSFMRACGGRVAVKGGAEGVNVAMIPELGVGIALKIADGAARASEAALAAILIRLGMLDADDPVARRHVNAPQRNWRGTVTGELRAAPGFA